MTELDDDLAFDVPDDGEPIQLTGEAEANRMMRRLRFAQAEAIRVMQLAADDIAQTQAWRDRRLQTASRAASWAHASLEGWLRAMHAGGGPQTVKLPAGTVSLRKAQPRIEVAPVETAEQAAAWDALAASLSTDEAPVASPVTPTWKIGKREVGAMVQPGASIGEPDPDGYLAHHAVTVDGEAVPGVIVHVPSRKSFSATPATSIEDLDAEVGELSEAG